MFYENSKADHGLPFNPFKAIVAPRPIGWISTISKKGKANLAPYSFFNAIGDDPEMVMFSSDGWKDSVTNIKDTGEFVCNYMSLNMMDEMNITSAPTGEDEFKLAKLATEKCNLVSVPRVKVAPAALECKLFDIVDLKSQTGKPSSYKLVIGEVVGTHINDEFLKEGRFDVEKAAPFMRLGYKDYAQLGGVFQLTRPDESTQK